MDKSNSGDKVVKVIRVYESGRVRAARPPREWATAHAVPAEVTDKSKDPKKVAAGKARAAKAAEKRAGEALIRAAESLASKTAPKKKAAKPKATKKPAARKSAKASPFAGLVKGGRKPKAAAPKKPAAPRPDGRSKNAMVVVAFRVSPAQAKKLHRLGNGEFMRDRIDRAPEPK